eukprot:m.820656 g.820656  ORF g.820656 m.820656 type:complete len:62 (-) comp23397_c0_seq1:1428-1613(-)
MILPAINTNVCLHVRLVCIDGIRAEMKRLNLAAIDQWSHFEHRVQWHFQVWQLFGEIAVGN